MSLPTNWVTYDLAATHTSQSVAAWGGQDVFEYIGTIAAGDNTLITVEHLYAGPAIFDFSPWGIDGANPMTAWELQVPGAGMARTSAKDGNARHTGMIMIPAVPIEVVVTNLDLVTREVMVTLQYDLHRVG